MSHWGRDPRAGRWIGSGPQASIAAVVLAVGSVGLVGWWTYARLAPLQQYALVDYARSTVTARLGLGPERYTLVIATDRSGARVATNADLTDARSQVETTTARHANAGVRDALADAVYGGESLLRMFAWPLAPEPLPLPDITPPINRTSRQHCRVAKCSEILNWRVAKHDYRWAR